MFYKNKYLLIPVDLCKYALVHRKVNAVRIYIFLKAISAGKIRISNESIKDFSNELRINPKSFNKYLNLLIKDDWIGFNSISGYYFIRGFERIRKIEKFNTRSSCEFSTGFDLNRFKAFCISAFVAYCLNRGRSKRWRSERRGAGSRHNRQRDLLTSISHKILGSFLSTSKSTAQRYIYIGEAGGFLFVQKQFCELNINPKDIKFFRSLDSRIRMKNGKVVMQMPNIIRHNMHFRKRKKLEP